MKDFENKKLIQKKFLLSIKEEMELQVYQKKNPDFELSESVLGHLKKIGAIKGENK